MTIDDFLLLILSFILSGLACSPLLIYIRKKLDDENKKD